MADDFGMGYALGQDSSNCNSGGWGGFGEGLWAVIILAMIFGNNGWGFGGNGWGGINGPAGQGALTRADLCSEFNFNNLDNAVRGVQRGLCDGFYAQNTALMNGFHGVDNAVCQLGYQTQAGFNSLGAQMAQCCCDTQNAIQSVRYDLATQSCDTRNTIQSATRDLLESNNANTRAILDALTAQRIEAKDEKIAAQNQQIFQLQLAASQQAQNAYITANQEAQTAELIRRIAPAPVPSFAVPAPYPYCGAYGYNNGCGCC